MTSKKKSLGQFYTTNVEYICSGLSIPTGVNVIEPFVGKGDLLKLAIDCNIEMYDIDPKNDKTVKRDTLENPPIYKNKWVITNPPYIAKNKNENKRYYEKYNVNDLYKCFIKQILLEPCQGGILIIPLNFFCSVRKSDIDLRSDFIEMYTIDKLNIFEESVFDDTKYTVCSFSFQKRKRNVYNIEINIFPKKITKIMSLEKSNNYTFGGEIYNLKTTDKYIVGRLIKGQTPSTNLLLKCIDDSIDNKLGLSIVKDEDIYYDDTKNQSARSYATLTIEPAINIDKQIILCDIFNNILNDYRDKYHSLFLTNYRESNTVCRKRISFDLAYSLVKHILLNQIFITS